MKKEKTFKRGLSLILALTLILSSLNGIPITVFAAESTSVDGFTYEALNGTYCTITGYTGTATEVVIPSEIDGYIVQQISSNAFKNNTTIEKVVLPETVESVGSNLFFGCKKLTYIGFNSKLTNIGSSMFYGCTALNEITLPIGITSIGGSAFYGCTSLTEVNLPETLKTISPSALCGCTGLVSIDIPDSVTSMGHYAFDGCSNLTNVKLPLGWTTVDRDGYSSYCSPFNGCAKLTEITLPEGMTAVPSYAFDGCSTLKKISLPGSLETINSYAFRCCSGISELNLPNTVKTINGYAFYGCIGFRMLNLNENLESIGQYAFSGCNGLVSLVLNENLATLSNYAFANCANLTAARVPKSVTSFGVDSFNNCSKLTIYCYSGSAAHMALENTSYTYFLLDEHEHEYETTIETAATCTRGGSQIKTCTICEYNYIELVEALGHEYFSADTEPNCTEKGYTTYTCSRCNDTYKDNYVDALGHTYGDWQTETEPKCTTTGSKYQICGVCEHKNTETIVALGHSYSSEVIEPTCTKQGYTVHTCSVCKHSYKDTYVNANGHSYGDWIVDVAATVLSEGSRHRDCSVCEYTETQTIERVEIDIDTNTNYGLANFTVVNAQTLEPISGAQIFISTEKDGENTFTTDTNGQVSIVLPVGKQAISVYADKCITRNLNINVKSGVNNIPLIGLSDKPTYEVTVNHHLMSNDEIIEAGIDTSAAENNHVYKYELHLEFTPEIDWESIAFYWGDNGICLGSGWVPKTSTGGGYYHIERESSDGDIDIYPVSEYFYLIISGKVKWLKEMFDVEMLILNNSQTDTLEDLVATLELPDGLSLATMIEEQQTEIQEVGTVEGGGSKSVHWYVRGDTAGSYEIKALLEGMVMPFEEEIYDEFIAQNALQVWAGNALHLDFSFPDAAFYGEDYPVTITLTNVSDITLYNVSHVITGVEQGRVTYYSDGHVEEEGMIKRKW